MNIRSSLMNELRDSVHPLIYMSTPKHFDIGVVSSQTAKSQWNGLYEILSELTEVRTIECNDSTLPDVTFIANAGSYLPTETGYAFFPATFLDAERKREGAFFIKNLPYPNDLMHVPQTFEGDCDLLRLRDLMIAGFGHRTNFIAVNQIASMINATRQDLIDVQLVDPRFYHLDTCFFYHNHGNKDFCMIYPGAFAPRSYYLLCQICTESEISMLLVTDEEADMMVCNSVGVGDKIIGHTYSDRISNWLSDKGFKIITTPLDKFVEASKSAKSLTLRVPRQASQAI